MPEELQGMLKPFPAELMRAYKISSRVNSVKNDEGLRLLWNVATTFREIL